MSHGTIDRGASERRGMDALGEMLEHRSGLLLVSGGLMWVATYIVEVLIGVTLGEDVYASPELSSSVLVWLWPATFMAAIFLLSSGLAGVAVHIGRRARVLASLGGALVLVALGASFINLVRLAGIAGEVAASDGLGFLGVVGVLGGSIVLGVAAIRARALTSRVRLTLALLPLAFVPAILVTIPLEGVAPDYVVADLPFPVVGLVLAGVGLALTRQRSKSSPA